jgi:hypothetical protein
MMPLKHQVHTYLALFADDTCIYATHCKEDYVAKSAAWSVISVVVLQALEY